jgi:hypothetical protein
MVKTVKTKEDRLKEGVNLLKQLQGGGVKNMSPGYQELKGKITDWVNSEDGWEGSISFAEYGRVAEVELPKWNNKSAGLNFKVVKRH